MNKLISEQLGDTGALGYPALPVWPTLLMSPSLRVLRGHATAFLALCVSALVWLSHGDLELALTAIVLATIVGDIGAWNMLGGAMEPLVCWSPAARDRAAMRRIEHILQFGNGVAAARGELGRLHARSVPMVRAITAAPSILRPRRASRFLRAARRMTTSGGAPSGSDDGGGDPDGVITSQIADPQGGSNGRDMSKNSTRLGRFVFRNGVMHEERADRTPLPSEGRS